MYFILYSCGKKNDLNEKSDCTALFDSNGSGLSSLLTLFNLGDAINVTAAIKMREQCQNGQPLLQIMAENPVFGPRIASDSFNLMDTVALASNATGIESSLKNLNSRYCGSRVMTHNID